MNTTKSKTTLLTFTFILAIIVCFGAKTLFATTMIELTLSDLCKESSDIVVVEVVSTQSYIVEAKNRIYTTIELKILDKVKGQFEQNDKVSLKVFGGTVNGITTIAVGAPMFIKGEKSVIFLEERTSIKDGQVFVVVGMGQGKFDINVDEATREERIVRDEIDIPLQLEKDGARLPLTPAEPGKLDDFLNYIKGYIQ